MSHFLKLLVLGALLLSGCAAGTRFESAHPGTRLTIGDRQATELPAAVKLPSKSTGQHEFMAEASDGNRLYGILPLRVNGGKMAASIMFFAPALFLGGFRDVFPYYQFDVEDGVLRYKTEANDEWRLYQPTTAEQERARAYFQRN